MRDAERSCFAPPPMFWAPFIVVGEGGVYKVNNGGSESGVRIRRSAKWQCWIWPSEGYFRPYAAVHSLDQMTLHSADSGRSFQMQQSHGREGRFIARIQT